MYLIKNICYSTSHKKNYGAVKLYNCEILAKFSLAHLFMKRSILLLRWERPLREREGGEREKRSKQS